MSSREERKKAIQAYKERKEVGGIYRLVNTQTNWQSPLLATPNLRGLESRLQFAKKTNTCVDPSLQSQWAAYGPDAFALVEVEQLEKKPEQTPQAFREELAELLALHEAEA